MNFPPDFISSVRPLLGSETELFLSALSGDASVSLRLNPSKAIRNPMEPVFPSKRVPWSHGVFTWKSDQLLPLIPFFMPDIIMCRKPLLCL